MNAQTLSDAVSLSPCWPKTNSRAHVLDKGGRTVPLGLSMQ